MSDERPDLRLLDGEGETSAAPEQLAAWQGPPWPHPDDVRLRVVVEAAVAAYESGETTAHGAILHAAVHGWYEGYQDADED